MHGFSMVQEFKYHQLKALQWKLDCVILIAQEKKRQQKKLCMLFVREVRAYMLQVVFE